MTEKSKQNCGEHCSKQQRLFASCVMMTTSINIRQEADDLFWILGGGKKNRFKAASLKNIPIRY